MLSTQVSTHSVGGVAHYSCPRGYYMEGNETRVCLQNGSWSGSMPACFCKYPTFDFFLMNVGPLFGPIVLDSDLVVHPYDN